MLDQHAVYQQLKQAHEELFVDRAQERDIVFSLFERMLAADFPASVYERPAPWLVARWRGPFVTTPLKALTAPYQVVAVDGSQVYPDRHEGTLCALINVGGITLQYGQQSSATVFSVPVVYPNTDGALTPELIDCLRQEHELIATCQQGALLTAGARVVLIDGSLVAWQLNDKPEAVRTRYLTSYLACMHQLYEQRVAYAGYVSMPHNKDIVNLVRWYASKQASGHEERCTRFVDSDLVAYVLADNERSMVFESAAELCAHYPPALQPFFYYLRVGDEVARVELPRWVCDDEATRALVEGVIIDQCQKGQGYPLALAEAHAQAVIKTADRILFYRLIAQSAQGGVLSRKLFCKRRLCA